MPFFKQDPDKKDAPEYRYTSADPFKRKLFYRATVYKGRLSIVLDSRRDDEEDSDYLAEIAKIPLEVIEDAMIEHILRRQIGESFNNTSKWKLAVIPKDEVRPTVDSALLSKFEEAVIKKQKMLDAKKIASETSSTFAYEDKMRYIEKEISKYRAALLTGEPPKDEGW